MDKISELENSFFKEHIKNIKEEDIYSYFNNTDKLSLCMKLISCFLEEIDNKHYIVIDKEIYDILINNSNPQCLIYCILFLIRLNVLDKGICKGDIIKFKILDEIIIKELKVVKDCLNKMNDEQVSKMSYIKDTIHARSEIEQLREQMNNIIYSMEKSTK